MRSLGGNVFKLLGVLAALGAGAAFAQVVEPKVEVMADVVYASNEGNRIDPVSLKAMKEEFDSAKIFFTSYVRLLSQKVALAQSKPVDVKLPNTKSVSLTMIELKDGTATVKVKGPGAEATVQLGRSGSVYQRVGAHEKGQLILALSPVGS